MTNETFSGTRTGRAFILLFFTIVVGALSLVGYVNGSSLTALIAACFAFSGGLTAIFSLIYLILERRAETAKSAGELLKSSLKGRGELFEESHSREQLAFRSFCKNGTPIATFVTAVIVGTAAFLLFRKLGALEPVYAQNALRSAAITLVPLFTAFFVGSYFSGLSREEGMRWFRAPGVWLLASAFVLLMTEVAFILEFFFEGSTDFDALFAKCFTVLMGLVGLELILGLVLDVYRPDFDAEEKPAYESKILTIVFQPGGIAKNIAEVINYQFGFSVSNTWFFRFMEKMVLPFFMGTAGLAYLMSSVVFIDSDSEGIKEQFGRVVSSQPLKPGVHFKLPYPFGRIRQFPVKKIQEFNLGYALNDEHQLSEVIVWTRSHVSSEENFLLPDSRSGMEGSDSIAVSFLTVRIPVRYVVKDLHRYLYNFQDGKAALQKLAQAEVLAYLANSDFFDFLSKKRLEASEEMTALIQKAADKAKLGVEVVYVNLLATHPPVVVGDAFQEVTSAMERKEALILEAMAYANRVIPEAKGRAEKLVSEAESLRFRTVKLAKAEVELFKSQSTAHRVFERYYETAKELEVMERTVDRRKYVVPAGYPSAVYDVNLEDKLQPDLMDLEVVPNVD